MATNPARYFVMNGNTVFIVPRRPRSVFPVTKFVPGHFLPLVRKYLPRIRFSGFYLTFFVSMTAVIAHFPARIGLAP
jgi:hypothetical protein